MSFEIVSDLRWTDVLKDAPDIMSWANAGPGCARGLSRLVYGSPRGYFARGSKTDQEKMNNLMQDLLDMSYDQTYWPAENRQWEMREVEHWLCEFDKYVRAIDGTSLKRRYREGANA